MPLQGMEQLTHAVPLSCYGTLCPVKDFLLLTAQQLHSNKAEDYLKRKRAAQAAGESPGLEALGLARPRSPRSSPSARQRCTAAHLTQTALMALHQNCTSCRSAAYTSL